MRKRELKRQAQNWQDEFWAAREKIDLLQVQLRQAFKRNQQVDKERVDWKRWCVAAERRAADLAEVLREIAEQDAVENALDPQWAARVATEALRREQKLEQDRALYGASFQTADGKRVDPEAVGFFDAPGRRAHEERQKP